MAAARVVVDTITKIMDRMSSLPDFGDKTITENIKRYLSTIREVAEHSDDAATPSMNWLFGVTDALNDLWDLLEDQDLPKQSNNIASFFSPCSRTPHRRPTLLLELEQIEKQLKFVAAARVVVVDTITKIMDRMSSLPDFGDKTITENIKRYLSTIKEVAEHSDDAATPSMNWLFGVTDALNDLWDLLEDQDLPKQSNNIASFFSPCSRTPHRRPTLLLQLEQIEKQLKFVAAARVVVVDTITKIMDRMSSLPDFGYKTITENIKRYLSTIKEVAEHSDDGYLSMNWLFGVTDALNDLWDLLEDQDLPKQSNNIASFFSPCCRTSHRRRTLLLELEQIEKQLVVANSTKALPENTEKLIACSEQETKMVGRENVKEQIISQVLSMTEVKGAVKVVPILAMRGMGKTTLVRSVCRDDRVRRSFDGFVIWVDGIHSEVYAKSIFKCIIRRMKKKDDKDLKLGKASSRRFLLVLDDLQSETLGELLTLKQMLTKEASSSITFTSGTILVTTRNFFVAREAGSSYFSVRELGEVDSRALFERTAGEGGGGSGGLKIKDAQMKKMVKKCGGVPIAIEKMARMLKSSEAITEPDIEHLEEELMREMKLIYYDELPSWHQKQCFAYLSMIFPSASDSVHKNTLIRLWTAEGFLGQLQPEVLGDECLEEFVRRSILCCDTYHIGKVSRYSMYSGLMLELSRFVAGKVCFCMDYDGDDNVKETVRRVVLTPDFDVSNGIPKFLGTNNKNLCSIIFLMPYNNGWPSRIPHEVKLKWPSCDSIFRAFNNLRVLILTDLGMKTLPVSIGGLKSLRYLDLSHNNMKKLPDSIGKLRHLQTLILSHCHKLRGLPNEVKHLVSLRHLEMEGCFHLTHLPSALKKLTNLQTLSHFMVSTNNSNNHQKHTLGLGELANMNNLRGQLEISHLEGLKFKEPEHEGYAYLKEKEHLVNLNLQWSHDEADDNNDDNNHEQISLELLEPHPNLQELNIRGYGGINFSQWLSSLKSLARLALYNCSKCKCLPPLDQFSQLLVLRLERLDSLECITDQDDNCSELGLGRLERLYIRDCPNLTSWWKGTHNDAKFGSMSLIEVRYCPKLECLPLFPDLYFKLVLESSSVKPLLDTINYTSASNSMVPSDSDSIADSFPPLYKLAALEIKNVEEQYPVPENWLKNFISLHYLCIREKMSLIKGFKHLISLKILIIANCARVDLPDDEWEGLQSLQQLLIEEVTELECLPEGFKHLTSLTGLTIRRCPDLTRSEGIGHLTSLTNLGIAECKKLASLPRGMADLKSLRKLQIRNCPLLLPRCQAKTGDDWPQIQHIKDIELTGSSEVYDE